MTVSATQANVTSLRKDYIIELLRIGPRNWAVRLEAFGAFLWPQLC